MEKLSKEELLEQKAKRLKSLRACIKGLELERSIIEDKMEDIYMDIDDVLDEINELNGKGEL